MKFTSGQILSMVIALACAALLIYDAPFEAAAAAGVAAASSQVVYAPLFEPPVINGLAGRIDFPLLLLELAFVVFVGGIIFFAAGQKKKNG